MTAELLLSQLHGVRRAGRGWVGCCPAHDDRTPSMSIREGEDGRILLHDFGGCHVDQICAALGIRLTDLFPEQGSDPRTRRESQHRRNAERARQVRERRGAGLRADVLREAERVIRTARGMDIHTWSAARLDRELDRLADAYELLDRVSNG